MVTLKLKTSVQCGVVSCWVAPAVKGAMCKMCRDWWCHRDIFWNDNAYSARPSPDGGDRGIILETPALGGSAPPWVYQVLRLQISKAEVLNFAHFICAVSAGLIWKAAPYFLGVCLTHCTWGPNFDVALKIFNSVFLPLVMTTYFTDGCSVSFDCCGSFYTPYMHDGSSIVLSCVQYC